MLLCGALLSCESALITENAAPAVLTAIAPTSMEGKTVELDHSQAFISQLGVSSDPVNVQTHSWTDHSGDPVTNGAFEHAQWSTPISFMPGTTSNEANVTYSYKKISDTEALIEGRWECGEEEWYAVAMKLKFVSPTEAEAMYYKYSVDDISYFFTNVRARIK